MLGETNNQFPLTRAPLNKGPHFPSEAPGVMPERIFATTHWSVVLAAANQGTPEAAAALERLCCTYWYPLYAYVRRRGHGPDDAQDLTQEFFARLLERNVIAGVKQTGARFRSFLLVALNNFVATEWRRSHTQKRGGCVPSVPLEAAEFETRYARDLATPETPDRTFDRHWARTLLDRALQGLAAEQEAAGKKSMFDVLLPYLTGADDAAPYAEVAARLQITLPATRTAVHRLRRRYGELLRFEVAQTVASPADVQEELRHLLASVSGE